MHRRWATWSLRHRLVLIAGCAMGLTLLVGWLGTYCAAEIEETQMRDARLEQVGSTILAFVEDELALETNGIAPPAQLKTRPVPANLYRYQVWTSGGALVLRSHEAPSVGSFARLGQLGFSNVTLHGDDYRTFALPSRDGHYVVQVAERLSEQVSQLTTVAGYSSLMMTILFGLILIATSALLSRALAPILSIASQLTERNPLDATELEVANPPEDLLPVLRSLNSLLARTGMALSVERRFTSVAAHEMRTPLAGLRAHAQLAISARTDQESREALDAMIQGVDRASHMLGQLLDIARIEGVSRDPSQHLAPVDVTAILEGVVGDLRATIDTKSIRLTSTLRSGWINGLPMALLLILRNLVTNAVMYCPAGGRVHVSTLVEAGRATLIVDDSGPGIPAADRELAFERFNRLGQQHIDGVGLGLSIVLMAVELHGARIALLDSPLGGLRCKVDFGIGSIKTADANESVLKLGTT